MRALINLSQILIIIGGINWGLVGLFNWNLVAAIFRGDGDAGSVAPGERVIYIIVGVAALIALITLRRVTKAAPRR